MVKSSRGGARPGAGRKPGLPYLTKLGIGARAHHELERLTDEARLRGQLESGWARFVSGAIDSADDKYQALLVERAPESGDFSRWTSEGGAGPSPFVERARLLARARVREEAGDKARAKGPPKQNARPRRRAYGKRDPEFCRESVVARVAQEKGVTTQCVETCMRFYRQEMPHLGLLNDSKSGGTPD